MDDYANKIREDHRNYNRKNREKILAYNREWKKLNREKVNEYQNRRYHARQAGAWTPRSPRDAKTCKENLHFNTMKTRFGINKAKYEEMLQAQAGVCAICQQICAKNTRLSIDHHHDTGKVRGLLCNNCNTGIGLLKDDSKIIASAASYVNRHPLEELIGIC